MQMITEIIAHTPVWVFPLILFVLLMSARNLRPRQASPRSLFILPIVLVCLSAMNAVGTGLPPVTALGVWIVAIAIGGVIGWAMARPPRHIDREAGRIELAGSALPLIVCIGIVGLRYYFGYLFGRYPALHGDPTYAIELIAGGAFLGGITLGRYGHLGWWYHRSGRAYPAAMGAERPS